MRIWQRTTLVAASVGAVLLVASAGGDARAAIPPSNVNPTARGTIVPAGERVTPLLRVPSQSLRPVQPAATTACLTRGTGGAETNQMNRTFTDADGQTSKYHLFTAGTSASTARGLLIYFHGDGAYEIENPDYELPGIEAQARSKNMLMLAPLTPDATTTTWWENGAANGVWANELVKQVAFSGYNIDRSKIWLVGYSGGSQFITKVMMPKYSGLICGGGAIIFGGGGAPSGASFTPQPALLRTFRMHWYTGANDTGADDEGYDALADSDRGSAHYQRLGFAVTKSHPAGVNHSNIPFSTVVGQQLATVR